MTSVCGYRRIRTLPSHPRPESLGSFHCRSRIVLQTLALELAPRGIRVNTVSPGPVATEAFAQVLGVSDKYDELASTIPLGRMGTPDDIAAAVLFLASPASSWVTGEHLLVAGGRTQRSYQYQPRES